jgi:hypothetical protein
MVGVRNSKCSGITPVMVKLLPSSVRLCPRTSLRPESRLRQKRSETTTRWPSGETPTAGSTPSVSKKSTLTIAPRTRSGSERPVRLKLAARKAESDRKLRFRSFQSRKLGIDTEYTWLPSGLDSVRNTSSSGAR